MTKDFTFRGNWGSEDEVGSTWENWKVMLFGDEAGDFLDDPEEIRKVLKASGYELILREVKK